MATEAMQAVRSRVAALEDLERRYDGPIPKHLLAALPAPAPKLSAADVLSLKLSALDAYRSADRLEAAGRDVAAMRERAYARSLLETVERNDD